MELGPGDFAGFFRSVHGCEPFPWQQALVNRLADSDTWPDVLDLPTGSGKTAALDAAVFHLALRADMHARAALRIALVVDRTLVVDDGFARANRIAGALDDCLQDERREGGIVSEVARRLKKLAGPGGPPLAARRILGGAPLEDDWARTPTQPTILCSTVDQVGSRLLFRGYGVSDRMKPVHAGLLGTGSLILLDEAHLAEPFRQTLESVCKIGQARIKVALLSATPGKKAERTFGLSVEDREDSELGRRINARKPAAMRRPLRVDASAAAEPFALEAIAMADRLRERGVHPPAVGVVVNRGALARKIFTLLEEDSSSDALLMIGRSRGIDGDAIANSLAPFRTGERSRPAARPLFVVATQCLEVGTDLDLDGLVTQAAPLDALRQRFGRLNRAGRPVDAEGAVLALSKDIAKSADDPAYGDRIGRTWNALESIAENGVVDFGVGALAARMKKAGLDPDDLASARPDAPVLMPAYLDLWSQTSPRPAADPDIGLFLHGTERTSAGVSIVWRGDISQTDLAGETFANPSELMRLVPPRAAEAVELPLWIARAWLRRPEAPQADLPDTPQREPDFFAAGTGRVASRPAFRWAGLDDPCTGVVDARDLRPGDLIVVPAGYGGCDSFGWAPDSGARVADVADAAARPHWGRRCAVRVSPGLLPRNVQWERVSAVLADEDVNGLDLVGRLIGMLSGEVSEDKTRAGLLPGNVRMSLDALRRATGRIDVHFPYAGGPKGGAILVAEKGICELPDSSAAVPATEDDTASHSAGRPVRLDRHGDCVARLARRFAETLGLGDVAEDLCCAAFLHDAGKADPRFQAMLAGGDPWNRPDGPPLARSGRSWSPHAWTSAGLPRGWRHEALSVNMARTHPHLAAARDPALVLWLIGSHHGLGRPFFDFVDPAPERPLPCLDVTEWRLPENQSGPQALMFDHCGADWPALFEDLKRRCGIWGLAHLEAILRLADHRASEEESAS